MGANEQSAVVRMQNKLQRLRKNLQVEAITPLEFCAAFFEIVLHAACNERELDIKPGLEGFPRAVLKLLGDFFTLGYHPPKYTIDYASYFRGSRFSDDQYRNAKAETVSVLRSVRNVHIEPV